VLVLSRKIEQSLMLGSDITLTVLAIEGDRVKLGIRAPRTVSVLRQELFDQLQAANTAAVASPAELRRVAAALGARRTPDAATES
jgi:carbon storage regulator